MEGQKAINESALLESKSLRDSVLERTDALDRVKALSLLPDGMHVTTAMVAAYFGVTGEVIRQLTKRHREELEVNGMAVLRGADLRKFESDNMSLSLGSYPQARRSLTIYKTSGEHRRELVELREDIQNVERKLCWHHRRISTLEGDAPTDQVRASIAAMTWQAFERHVADLLRRDGCMDVVVRQARSDRGIDITGRTADGRSVAVQCKNRAGAGRSSIASADMQKFAGAARAVNHVDVALSVATCNFSHEAQAIADLSGVITVNRDELDAWTAGVHLKALR
ncbi:restriction endonuclease [Streptomyces sp. NPDC058642]|uniref:restriction endonuclease n=1 Tax=Streptomyces sp. NPDC058642 TaxID=3346572 RepID=UPI003665FAF8